MGHQVPSTTLTCPHAASGEDPSVGHSQPRPTALFRSFPVLQCHTQHRGQHEKARIISQTLLKHRITYDSSDTTQCNTKTYSKLSSSQRGYTLPNTSMGNAELQLQDRRGPGSGGTEERESTLGTQLSKGYQMLHFRICLRFLLCKMRVVAATA